MDRSLDRSIDIHIGWQMDGWVDGQIDRQIDKEIDYIYFNVQTEDNCQDLPGLVRGDEDPEHPQLRHEGLQVTAAD